MLKPENRLQFTPDLSICRLLNGMWQVGGGHGKINAENAIKAMLQYHDAGFTTWDLADHYGPAEDFIGEFRRQLEQQRGKDAAIQAFTKWVPRPGKMTREIVERNIDISLRRMQVESLDLLQFHWWEYRDAAYLEALGHLTDLINDGKIKHLALTNFDTKHLEIIVRAGIPIVSNQVQFSLVDQRPLVKMTAFCQQYNIKLLAYGTLCGGLLNEKFLGIPDPGAMFLNTASLRKYKNMIELWGSWTNFQKLLATLKSIAHKYQVSMANVATRYILDQPTVAGVIIGGRLGVSQHLEDNARVFDLTLTLEDYQAIEKITALSYNLFEMIGDCGDEYRR